MGNALAFEEQALQSGVYTSPVMTAVLAAFSEPELLASARTSEYEEIRSVFEGLLAQQMIVQATLSARFVAAAKRQVGPRGRSTAGCGASQVPLPSVRWTSRRWRVMSSTAVGPFPARAPAADLPHAADLGPIRDGATRVAVHPTGPRPADGALWKYVTVADADMPRLVQVGLPIGGQLAGVAPVRGGAFRLMRPGQTSWAGATSPRWTSLRGGRTSGSSSTTNNARLAELVFRVRFDGFSY